jgi:hypothetical protein
MTELLFHTLLRGPICNFAGPTTVALPIRRTVREGGVLDRTTFRDGHHIGTGALSSVWASHQGRHDDVGRNLYAATGSDGEGGQGSGHHHQEHVSPRSGNLAAGEGVLKTTLTFKYSRRSNRERTAAENPAILNSRRAVAAPRPALRQGAGHTHRDDSLAAAALRLHHDLTPARPARASARAPPGSGVRSGGSSRTGYDGADGRRQREPGVDEDG